MDYSVVFAISLLLLGLALIIAELFIPSGGVISLLSFVCLVAALYSAHDAWWDQHRARFWWFVGSSVGLIPFTIGATLFLISRTRLGNRVLLEAPKLEDVTPYSQEAEQRKQLIGKRGKTLTLMTPGGLVIVEGKRHHAEAEGQMLDPEQPIQVIAVRGNRVVVRPYEPSSEEPATSPINGKSPSDSKTPQDKTPLRTPPSDELAETTGDSRSAPLDFEIPEG
ncbi:MAG: hypothetical protein KDA84_15695 [Planctomycetaceae bacterium]|nr:hypothetical protein [Planctomycetaceae bacterium]